MWAIPMSRPLPKTSPLFFAMTCSHAINTVDETRRQAAVSRAAQPKYATQHPPGGGKGSTYERAANKGKGKGGGTSSKGKGKSPANAEAANPRHNDAGLELG